MIRDYGTSVVTPAAELSVSLDDLREHLGFAADNTDQDGKLDFCARAAEEFCQSFMGRQFVTATRQLLLDRWPLGCDPIHVPFAPLVSVSSLQYIDEDGASQTWNSSNYTVITKQEPGKVALAWETTWPAIRPVEEAITLEYVCGYGEPQQVPEVMRQAVLLLAADYFEQRVPMGSEAIPWNMRVLLESLRVPDDYIAYARGDD